MSLSFILVLTHSLALTVSLFHCLTLTRYLSPTRSLLSPPLSSLYCLSLVLCHACILSLLLVDPLSLVVALILFHLLPLLSLTALSLSRVRRGAVIVIPSSKVQCPFTLFLPLSLTVCSAHALSPLCGSSISLTASPHPLGHSLQPHLVFYMYMQ